MKGKIVITCDEHGTHVHTEMTEMAKHGDAFLVHALGKSLGLGPEDYIILSIAEAEGVLDKTNTPTVVNIDMDELCKQLLEENQDAC